MSSRNNCRIRGENRFYNPPPLRKLQEERERKTLEEKTEEKKKMLRQEEERELGERERSVVAAQKGLTRSTSEKKIKKPAAASVVATGSSEECASSDCSVSSRVGSDASNLDRFLECTTPFVPVHNPPRTSAKDWRNHEPDCCPYFNLDDLWDSFEEWSVYGAGVPLLLDGSYSVVQYYVPYLSAIQLYTDPSRTAARARRRFDEESDAESSRGTSSDERIDCGTQNSRSSAVQIFNGLSVENNKPVVGPSSGESEISNSPGQLICQYMEHDSPFGREPLADKISKLASEYPVLRTYQSCDLSPSSWVSVAWYPIYRIPTGPTLQNLEACFLTFHCLSTPSQGTSVNGTNSYSPDVSTTPISGKLPLPTLGLASYKLKVSVWNPNGTQEYQKAASLLQAADNWLRKLQVYHPDYTFFVSHSNS